MRAYWISLIAILACSGCATDYRPPRDPPPPQWTGSHGFRETGPPKVSTGIRRAGDTLIAIELAFVRTGVLAQEVQAKTAFGGTMVLPKGSKAYATNYTLFMSSSYTRPTNVQTKLDPIEWCVVVPNGFDGKRGSQTACIFYETPERARYMEDFSSGGFPFDPFIEVNAAGMPGPVPVIDEQPVDFGARVTRELRVTQVEAGGFRVESVLSDGTNTRKKEQRFIRWPASKAVVVSGLRIKAIPGDPSAVEVSIANSAPDLAPKTGV